MITFLEGVGRASFLPVLIGVILGPALIQVFGWS